MRDSPAPASTVVVLRRAAEAFEVLLVRRRDSVAAFAGAHVFPGGCLDQNDRGGDLEVRHRMAACRELFEEAGISVDPASLAPFARWITPEQERKRFDAMFYVVQLPAGQEARHDGAETTECRWLTPAAALALAARDDIRLAPPTWITLETLAGYSSIEEALRELAAQTIVTLQPSIIDGDGMRRLEIPGDTRRFACRDGRWAPLA